ncbi:hypothetical protein JKP88DRAFT_253771 [Tribonema minus]|uniref:Uncharacterized protein n=1 Tax=Tribonema minus TaxID=303371 RepID=A0A836CJ13_9STRA|nr:hypothetical protein JKP88DRAFT_253771 [Tribonema minus]
MVGEKRALAVVVVLGLQSSVGAQTSIVKCDAYADTSPGDCSVGPLQVNRALQNMTDPATNPNWTGYCDRVYIRVLDSMPGGPCSGSGVDVRQDLFSHNGDTFVTLVPTATEVVMCETQQFKIARVRSGAFRSGLRSPMNRVAVVNQLDQFTGFEDGAFDGLNTEILDLRGDVYLTGAGFNPNAFDHLQVNNRTLIPTSASDALCPYAAPVGPWETWHMDYDSYNFYGGAQCYVAQAAVQVTFHHVAGPDTKNMHTTRNVVAGILLASLAAVQGQTAIVKCSAYADANSNCRLTGNLVINALKNMINTATNPDWTGYCDRVYIRVLDSMPGGPCSVDGVVVRPDVFSAGNGVDTFASIVPTASEVVLCETQQFKVARIRSGAFRSGLPRPMHRIAIVNQVRSAAAAAAAARGSSSALLDRGRDAVMSSLVVLVAQGSEVRRAARGAWRRYGAWHHTWSVCGGRGGGGGGGGSAPARCLPTHYAPVIARSCTLDQFTALDDGVFDNVVTDILDLRGNVYMNTANAWNPQAFNGADVRNRTIIPTTADASRCPLAVAAANGHWETWHMDYDPLDMYSGGLC